jgi:uncharacterized protein (DUF427 family)
MPKATATVNGHEVASSSTYELIEGNIYVRPSVPTSSPHVLPRPLDLSPSLISQPTAFQFPPSALNKQFFTPSPTTTFCPYKGTASYYTVTTNKTELKDAAWVYEDPKPEYEKIKGYVAFYKSKPGVEVASE